MHTRLLVVLGITAAAGCGPTIFVTATTSGVGGAMASMTAATASSSSGGVGGALSACVPGEDLPCACAGGGQGVQVCEAGGVLGPCMCPSSTSTGPSGGACEDTSDSLALIEHSSVANDVWKCELSNIGNMSAVAMCIQMLDGLSTGCADCFAAYSGCSAEKCLTMCAPAPDSSGCQTCTQAECEPAFTSCTGLMNVNPMPDGG
jgi:hypothetical protein